MALQLNKATINPSNQVYLHSYPASGMPSSRSAYTLMLWVNSAAWATGATIVESIVGLYNGTPDAATAPTVGLQIGCDLNNTVSAWQWAGANVVNTTGYTPPNNTWIHVAFSCTAISGANQTYNIYINGVLNNTATATALALGTYTMVFINGYPQTTAQATTYTESSLSQVDDVMLFNRQLTANEILTIYNTAGLEDGISYGLASRYKFNELPIGSITTGVRDFSGLNNNLAVVNRGSGVVPTYIQSISNQDTRLVVG